MNHRPLTTFVVALAITGSAFASSQPVVLGDFSQYQQVPEEPWQIVRFDEDIPATDYRLRQHFPTLLPAQSLALSRTTTGAKS